MVEIPRRPHTIFSEHIADINRQLNSAHSLIKALQMQRDMLVKQEDQWIGYRQQIIEQDGPAYPYLSQ